jgi:hypothetical protein
MPLDKTIRVVAVVQEKGIGRGGELLSRGNS